MRCGVCGYEVRAGAAQCGVCGTPAHPAPVEEVAPRLESAPVGSEPSRPVGEAPRRVKVRKRKAPTASSYGMPPVADAGRFLLLAALAGAVGLGLIFTLGEAPLKFYVPAVILLAVWDLYRSRLSILRASSLPLSSLDRFSRMTWLVALAGGWALFLPIYVIRRNHLAACAWHSGAHALFLSRAQLQESRLGRFWASLLWWLVILVASFLSWGLIWRRLIEA